MKWSPILHSIAAITGVVGALILIAAWLAGSDGTIVGFSQDHLFIDAQLLLLVSIAFGIGTLIHQNQEKK